MEKASLVHWLKRKQNFIVKFLACFPFRQICSQLPITTNAQFSFSLIILSWQTQSLIKMLISSSQNMSAGVNSYKKGQRYVGDTHTLLRVLCHKKDKEASKFLKKHYRFPASSGNHLFYCLMIQDNFQSHVQRYYLRSNSKKKKK